MASQGDGHFTALEEDRMAIDSALMGGYIGGISSNTAAYTTCSGRPDMPRRTSKPPMKNYGAQPFDEKEWGITREQLHDEMKRFGENTTWCHRNEEMLRKKYPDRWVVVEDGKVIMADPDHANILKMLRARSKGIDAAYIHFISKVKHNLVV